MDTQAQPLPNPYLLSATYGSNSGSMEGCEGIRVSQIPTAGPGVPTSHSVVADNEKYLTDHECQSIITRRLSQHIGIMFQIGFGCELHYRATSIEYEVNVHGTPVDPIP
jgi:hypothetical protein